MATNYDYSKVVELYTLYSINDSINIPARTDIGFTKIIEKTLFMWYVYLKGVDNG